MQIHLYLKKLILFLLLCVLVASGVHTVPASPSVVTAQSGDNSVFMRASSFCQPDDCLAEQISTFESTDGKRMPRAEKITLHSVQVKWILKNI